MSTVSMSVSERCAILYGIISAVIIPRQSCQETGTLRLECFNKRPGLDYVGRLNVTVSGRSCLPWSDSPAGGYNVDAHFPDGNIVASGANYCRHPMKKDGTYQLTAQRPWCFTTDAAKLWEECGVPLCQELCKQTPTGVDYRGYINRTKNGHDCLFWLIRPFLQDFSDKINISWHNFCRNPNSSLSAPWCYVQKYSNSELCDVPTCPTPKNVSISFNLTIETFKYKLSEITFRFGIILFLNKNNWQMFTKETLKLDICSEASSFSLAIIDENSTYFFLGMNCRKISGNINTTQAIMSEKKTNKLQQQQYDNYSISTEHYTGTDISQEFSAYADHPVTNGNDITTSKISLSTTQSKVTKNKQEFSGSESFTAGTFTFTEKPQNDDNLALFTTKDVPDVEIKTDNSSTTESNFSTSKGIICCPCKCSVLDIRAQVQSLFWETYKQNIMRHLKIYSFNLSRKFRMKMSAKDGRIASLTTGIAAILITAALILGIVLFDVCTFVNKMSKDSRVIEKR